MTTPTHPLKADRRSTRSSLSRSLVKAVIQGDFRNTSLWNEGRWMLCRWLRTMGASVADAEDLAQEVLCRLLRCGPGLHDRGPSRLLWALCHSAWVDHRRHGRALEAADGIELGDEGADPEALAIEREQGRRTRAAVQALLESLNPEAREVIRRRLAGEAPAAIAESMDPATFRALHRGQRTAASARDRRASTARLKAFRNRPNVVLHRFRGALAERLEPGTGAHLRAPRENSKSA